MRTLQRNNIVDVFVWVDDHLPKHPKPGTKPTLRDSGVVTILLWDGLTEPHSTLKEIYAWIQRDYNDCFPRLPTYQNFVAHVHRLLPVLVWLLEQTLSTASPLRFVDSTMLPVCRRVRADRHRVVKNIAAWGKNHQGWWYGFKLHAAIDYKNKLAALHFTPANESDVLQLRHLVDQTTRIVVGDAGYTAKVTRRHLWRDYRCAVISPPRPKQTWTMSAFEQFLLTLRQKIEATFGRLKTKHKLVTSFPRSIKGYFVHYIRTLLGYQVG